jgi:hypothetical protein
MYRYAYIFGSSAFLLLWITIFVFRKDLRQQILFMSVMIALLGVFPEYFFYTTDWWKPETITGTRVGIEDLILGFTNGGIAAVLYEVVFRRRTRALRKGPKLPRTWLFGLTIILVAATTFWILGLHSFWATTITFIVSAFLIVLLRRDLLWEAVFGGLAMVTVSVPVYLTLFALFPGVVEHFWLLHNLSRIMVWGIPIEDLIFYFGAGALLAPTYEFIFEKRLVKLPRSG